MQGVGAPGCLTRDDSMTGLWLLAAAANPPVVDAAAAYSSAYSPVSATAKSLPDTRAHTQPLVAWLRVKSAARLVRNHPTGCAFFSLSCQRDTAHAAHSFLYFSPFRSQQSASTSSDGHVAVTVNSLYPRLV